MQNRRRDFGSTSLLFPYSFGLLLALAVTIFSPMACWFLTTVAGCENWSIGALYLANFSLLTVIRNSIACWAAKGSLVIRHGRIALHTVLLRPDWNRTLPY